MCPFTLRKPVGICIQAFASVTNAAEIGPLMTIGNALSQWLRGESLSQPYKYSPMKIASMKNAKPSSENGKPMMPPAYFMNCGHSKPNSKDRIVPETAPTANKIAIPLAQTRARS